MASKAPNHPQRAQAICNALVNGTATIGQMTRLADAFASLAMRDPSSLTQAEKATLVVQEFRGFALGTIKRYECELAADAARADTGGHVEADYAEAP